MPSFLTNRRMSPSLEARIRQSLTNDALSRVGGKNRRKSHLALRVAFTSAIVGLLVVLVVTYRNAEREFRTEKARLVERFQAESAGFDDRFFGRLKRIESLLKEAMSPYEGDLVAPQLSGRNWQSEMSGTLAYLRGPQRGFRTLAELRERASESGPDGLVRCLLDPPSSVDETHLLRHLGKVYEPSAFRGRFASLHSAWQAADFLQSPFGKRLNDTESARLLPFFERELKRAPLSSARSFAHAQYFMAVLDEPKPAKVVPDFDGEAEHYVRLFLIHLDTGEPLLRLRRFVDPSWISESSRLAYSRELDSCRLAFRVRQELRKKVRRSSATGSDE